MLGTANRQVFNPRKLTAGLYQGYVALVELWPSPRALQQAHPSYGDSDIV